MNLKVIDIDGRIKLNTEVSYFSLESYVIKYGISGIEDRSTYIKKENKSAYLQRKRVEILEIDKTDKIFRKGINFREVRKRKYEPKAERKR